MNLRHIWLTVAFGAISISSFGAPILVVNPSFEDPTLPDGTGLTSRPTLCGTINPSGFGCISFGTGWVKHDPDGDSAGTMNPTTGMFADPIPDGNQIAYSNGGLFYQVLSTNLQSMVTYTLSVWVGERQDVGTDFIGTFFENQGYFLELATGTDLSTRTTLARTSYRNETSWPYPSVNAADSTRPGYGNWMQITLTYTSLALSPNTPLMIVLGAPAVQSSFDFVQLSDDQGGVVPEPGTFGMLGLALTGLALRIRKR